MTPLEQLKMLRRIWGRKRGYVFMPWIPAAQARKADQRRLSWNEGQAYQWPESSTDGSILEHLTAHQNDDLYFAPMVFSSPERRTEFGITENRLWADLDEVDPRQIEEVYKPTHAWETSPGRYAAVWHTVAERANVTAPGGENHRLTAWLGADPSGWDTTQLLRVPGSANNKPDKPEGTRGQLLWRNRAPIEWAMIDELPTVKTVVYETDIDEQLIEGVNRHAVWGRVKTKVHKGIRKYLAMRDTDGFDRSEILWQIERELADAGCSLAEIVAIIRPTVWNKFTGRQDELKRLMNEAAKAIAHGEKAGEGVFAEDEPKSVELKPVWEDPKILDAEDPEWLVEGIIPVGGCGFIAGIPKSLKSWLALDLAISLAAGKYWMVDWAPVEPVNVLYIQEEDPATMVKQRYNTIGESHDITVHTKLAKNLYMAVYEDFDATDLAWQTWLSDTIRDYQIGIVIMDTLATIAPSVDVSVGREIKGEVLDPIKDIARTHNTAMLIVHHMVKSSISERAGQNMAGSGQVHAWTDFGFYIKDKQEKAGAVTLVLDHETKYTSTQTFTFTIDLDKGWAPEQPVDVPHGAQSTTPYNRVKASILEAIGHPDDVDPMGADLDISPQRRLRRAYVCHLLREGDLNVPDAAETLGCTEGTIVKDYQYLLNDYPEFSSAFVTR